MNPRPSFFLVLLIGLLWTGCRPNEDPQHQATPYEMPTPLFFPTVTNIPPDNPMTVEGIALGKTLFFDTLLLSTDIKSLPHPQPLSSEERGAPTEIKSLRDNPHLSSLTSHLSPLTSSCSSCHHPEHSFEYGPEASPAFLGTHHAMLPLINLAWNTTGFGWNGSIATLEDMVYAAYTDPAEINVDTTEFVKRLQQSDTYPALFKKAFGTDTITFILVEKAIAQYVRSLVFADSKFDRYLRGKEQLTQDELNGYLLFITEDGADCFHCHGGGSNALFTTNLFYNNGLDREFNDPNDRHAVTHDPNDRGAYKAPTLRNIALTAPYMHDGRFHTLDEVIDFYSDSVHYSEQISPLMHHVMQGGIRLTSQEKQQLKAFLNTLTDTSFTHDLP